MSFIFQEKIEPCFDCRIIVIGNQVFAFRMYTRKEDGPLDYRADFEKLQKVKHEAYDLPPEVAEGCLAMCRELSLTFGAFDFLIDRDGRHVFLELNANGQWLWLQLATGVPLAREMASFLLAD